jgi:hypothetical protein
MPRQRRRKVIVLGLPFDSIPEGERYKHLVKCQEMGKITELEARKSCLKQVVYEGVKLPKNELRPKATKQQAITYTPDFSYWLNGVQVVEDFKAAYSKTKKNIKAGIVGNPIVNDAAHLRHKLYQGMFPHAVFRIVVNPKIEPDAEEGYF